MMPPKPVNPAVAIDLDGTLLKWDEYRGEEHFGVPVPYALQALRLFKAAGWRVIVWTIRRNTDLVAETLEKHFPGLVDDVNTNGAWEAEYGYYRKLYADLYIDDRAWPWCGEQVDWPMIMNDLARHGWV